MSILIADDHSYFLDGLEMDLKRQYPNTDIYRATDGYDLVAKVKKFKPDLLITDFEMPHLDGLSAIKKSREFLPDLKVVVVTSYYDLQHIKALLKAHVRVILDKEYVKEYLLTAVNKALGGDEFFTKHIFDTVKALEQGKKNTPPKMAIPQLTRREKELLPYFLKGLNNKEIAEQVHLSPSTIDSHRNNIYLKFDVNSAAKLIAKAVKFGLGE
jgi:DNA-binding NarL/FixJ family response regulator